MPLKQDGMTPKELLPRCIIVDRSNKLALNAVSLSGPGLEFLLDTGRWQARTDNFFISLMSLAPTPEARLNEATEKFLMLSRRKREFKGSFGIQYHLSCPNGGLNPLELVAEAVPILEKADRILPPDVPFFYKFGPDLHHIAARRIMAHRRCDGLVIFNSMQFGTHPIWAHTPPVDWKKLFGTDDPRESPMAKRFPGFAGGLSGAPLFPFLLEWLNKAREVDTTDKHIQVGGGLFSTEAIDAVRKAGADSVAVVGSGIFIDPLGMPRLIHHALNQSWG